MWDEIKTKAMQEREEKQLDEFMSWLDGLADDKMNLTGVFERMVEDYKLEEQRELQRQIDEAKKKAEAEVRDHFHNHPMAIRGTASEDAWLGFVKDVGAMIRDRSY